VVSLLDGSVFALCVAGVVAGLWFFDEFITRHNEEERRWALRQLAIDSALGNIIFEVSVRKGVALPYRVVHNDSVVGFPDALSLVGFIALVRDGASESELSECVRAWGGSSVLHPCFG
jgi:hypothetical protein